MDVEQPLDRARGRATITATLAGTQASAEVYVASYARTPRFASVSAGTFSTCGVTPDGDVFCWGRNDKGQLGSGRLMDRCEIYDAAQGRSPERHSTFRCGILPVQVEGGVRFESVTVGSSFACGVAVGGRAYCWGSDEQGSLGDGVNGEGNRTLPFPVAGGITFRSLSAENHRVCGVSTADVAYCWGGGYAPGAPSAPQPVPNGVALRTIDLDGASICGLSPDGVAYCWGVVNGQSAPTAVETSLRFRNVHTSEASACALTAEGRAYCWGQNVQGELGNGTQTLSGTPVAVAGNFTFTSMNSKNAFSCGIATDGNRYCWGLTSRRTALTSPTRFASQLPLLAIGGGTALCAVTTGGYADCSGVLYGGERGIW